MKKPLLTLITIVLTYNSYSQIKSVKQVVYFINVNSAEKLFYSNNPKDSTIRILERFDKRGNLIYEQDFPSDRLWREYGAWEHDYIYDKDSRILKHREYYHSEKGAIVLMNEYFYSYPNLNKPQKANEILVSYHFRESEPLLREQIDTVTYKTVNTENLYVSDLKTSLKYDTINYNLGSFVVREDVSFNRKLLDLNQFILLLESNSIIEFEKFLKNNIEEISIYLKRLHLSDTAFFSEFDVLIKESSKSIGFKVSENFIGIFHKERDDMGNNLKTIFYNYYIRDKELSKNTITKTYFKYYK